MKTSTLLLAGFLLATPALAQSASPDYEPLKLIKKAPINYPFDAVRLGIKDGEAHVIVQIDENGQLGDCLVTQYSHPAFAERAVAAIKKWAFEPAKVGGQPRSSISELSFIYKADGIVVVDLNVNSYVEIRAFELNPKGASYRARTLRELDRIPAPTKIVKPHYPTALASKSDAVRIAVDFYIDEAGHVRLPAVSRETNQISEALAGAAVDAVAQWEFEPPLSHGRPCLVQARQEFTFQPLQPAAAAK